MRLAPILFVSALLVAPSVARADRDGEALASVCSQLIGTQVTQCLAAANGRWIDGGAARVCGQLIGTQVIQCVGTIAGKDYNRGEQQSCGQLIGTQVIQCLAQTGRPHYVAPPPPPQPTYVPPPPGPGYPPRRAPLTVSEIRAEIAAALEQMRANDPMGADRRLRRLLNDLR